MKKDLGKASDTALWLQGHALTADQRSILAGLVKGIKKKEDVEDLINDLSSKLTFIVPAESIYASEKAEAGTMCQQLRGLKRQSQDDEKKSLDQVAQAAAGLVGQLQALTPSALVRLRSHARDESLSSELLKAEQAGELERPFFVQFCVSLLEDLEAIATKAAADIGPSKTHRLSQVRAREVIRTFALAYHQKTGSLPPRNKELWTMPFMAALAPMVNASLGLHVVRTTIISVEEELAPPKT